MAVIHADGSKGQHVYRFIENAYEDRLFINDDQFVEAQDLHRHLDSLGILETKQLSRSHYKNILVNNAFSEHRSFAARFAFCSGTNKLTNISRVISGILNRVTHFSDLKKMVISTVLGEDKEIALSTKRDDLTQWINVLRESIDKALLKNAEPPIEFMNRLSKDKGLANYVVGQFFHLLMKDLKE